MRRRRCARPRLGEGDDAGVALDVARLLRHIVRCETAAWSSRPGPCRCSDRNERTAGAAAKSANAGGRPCSATDRNPSPSASHNMPNLASQRRTAFASMAANTDCRFPGEARYHAQHRRGRGLLLQRLGELPFQLGAGFAAAADAWSRSRSSRTRTATARSAFRRFASQGHLVAMVGCPRAGRGG